MKAMRNKRKDSSISTRIDKSLNEKLEKVILRTGKTKGEQVRYIIKKHIEIEDRKARGEVVCYMPILEVKEIIKTLAELEKIKCDRNNCGISDETIKIIDNIIKNLEKILLYKLDSKYVKEDM